MSEPTSPGTYQGIPGGVYLPDTPSSPALLTRCPSCSAALYPRAEGDRFEVACRGCSWARTARDYLAACLGGAPLTEIRHD